MQAILRLGSLVLLLLFASLRAQAQVSGPPWQLAMGSSGANVYHEATATDAAGNVYLVGPFIGTVRFGSTTLSSLGPGTPDLYVAKWNRAQARFEWALQAGGTDTEVASGIAVTSNGVYISGRYHSPTATFGTQTLTLSGDYSMFVAKITDRGSSADWAWALQPAGGVQNATAIATSGTDVYIAGQFIGATTFGTTTLTSNKPTNPNMFVAKLTDSGRSAAFSWATSAGAPMTVNYMAATGSSVYLTGYFGVAVVTLGSSTLTNTGSTSAVPFVVKLTDAGTTGVFVWAQQATATDLAVAYGLAVSGPNVYITGQYRGSRLTFGSTTLNSQGYFDIFVAKFVDAGSSGSIAWALSAGSSNPGFADSSTSLVASGNNLYLTGEIGRTATIFGPLTVTGSPTMRNMYLAKLVDVGSTANFAWIQLANSASSGVTVVGQTLALSGNTVYVGGMATGPILYGNHTLTNATGNTISYVAALTDPDLPLATRGAIAQQIQVFPNPARTTASVLVPGTFSPATVTLLDALGRPVRTAALLAAQRYEVSLTGLPVGVYVVQVQTTQATIVRQLIVE